MPDVKTPLTGISYLHDRYNRQSSGIGKPQHQQGDVLFLNVYASKNGRYDALALCLHRR